MLVFIIFHEASKLPQLFRHLIALALKFSSNFGLIVGLIKVATRLDFFLENAWLELLQKYKNSERANFAIFCVSIYVQPFF